VDKSSGYEWDYQIMKKVENISRLDLKPRDRINARKKAEKKEDPTDRGIRLERVDNEAKEEKDQSTYERDK
jgi:hypothetical protein